MLVSFLDPAENLLVSDIKSVAKFKDWNVTTSALQKERKQYPKLFCKQCIKGAVYIPAYPVLAPVQQDGQTYIAADLGTVSLRTAYTHTYIHNCNKKHTSQNQKLSAPLFKDELV